MKIARQFLLGTALLALSHIALAEVAPDVLVKNTADEVLAIVKQDKDIQAGNQKKIFALAEEKILPNFDFDRASRMVLGKHWASASKEQQEAFKKEFRSLMLRT